MEGMQRVTCPVPRQQLKYQFFEEKEIVDMCIAEDLSEINRLRNTTSVERILASRSPQLCESGEGSTVFKA
eukprot:CAMPEP_0184737958 /NCGR_PEP_ID=MMETSP0315-20130426/708_1 /TAXON_ID=101924 /ORGANISM="Rhodosorus marinus, Strain UTEX LB 2760" /LENGTH=70 /DNA_ID=CAMNT_0027205437 /DNA_START=161 /DNA_END=373 /DNA_ORIENTATION=-